MLANRGGGVGVPKFIPEVWDSVTSRRDRPREVSWQWLLIDMVVLGLIWIVMNAVVTALFG